MIRDIRYQGAIIRNDQILIIRHKEHASGRSYWVLPGGGREPNESEEECVRREMSEETWLEVAVEGLLLDESGVPGGVYKRRKTYLCRVVGGDARPGYEPEPEAAGHYAIAEVRWFDLKDASTWGKEMMNDPLTYPQVQRIRAALGWSAESAVENGGEDRPE
jgi:8-oxo-dGTP pyrophosphatase MutT (NUDIX family)